VRPIYGVEGRTIGDRRVCVVGAPNVELTIDGEIIRCYLISNVLLEDPPIPELWEAVRRRGLVRLPGAEMQGYSVFVKSKLGQ
jgi:hypothetical protein